MEMTQVAGYIESGGVLLAAYTWGEPGRGPTVVLVHGYPDNARVWRRVAEQLASDHFVVAYDVRGAGASDRPTETRDYLLENLVADLGAVIDAFSPDVPVHLVGHDWGSIQSWEAVTTPALAGRIASYTSMSGPSLDHAGFWLRERLANLSSAGLSAALRQAAHSWYIGLFHLPGIAPLGWSLGGERAWSGFLKFVEKVRDPESNPEQVEDGRTGIRLYRANVGPCLASPRERRTDIPVQVLCPKGDHFMVREIWDDLPKWVPNLWRRDLDGGHWMLVSHPAVVAESVAAFVAMVESGQETPDLRRARALAQGRPGALSGQLAVVTGAGSGFGRECAVLFAKQGADVIAVDINEDAARRTADRCESLGACAWARQVDVSDVAQMQALADWVGEHFQAPDIVINNAGIGAAGSFFDTAPSDWDAVLGVNLRGVIEGSRLFGAQMKAQGRKGHLVNVASMGAYTPSRFMAAYNTSKAAVRMLSDCLRAELADDGIHVATICPGLSITNITRSTRFLGANGGEQERRRAAATRIYTRRNLRPEAIAKAILDAIVHRRDEVPVGMEAHAMRMVSRLSPGLSRRLARLNVSP